MWSSIGSKSLRLANKQFSNKGFSTFAPVTIRPVILGLDDAPTTVPLAVTVRQSANTSAYKPYIEITPAPKVMSPYSILMIAPQIASAPFSYIPAVNRRFGYGRTPTPQELAYAAVFIQHLQTQNAAQTSAETAVQAPEEPELDFDEDIVLVAPEVLTNIPNEAYTSFMAGLVMFAVSNAEKLKTTNEMRLKAQSVRGDGDNKKEESDNRDKNEDEQPELEVDESNEILEEFVKEALEQILISDDEPDEAGKIIEQSGDEMKSTKESKLAAINSFEQSFNQLCASDGKGRSNDLYKQMLRMIKELRDVNSKELLEIKDLAAISVTVNLIQELFGNFYANNSYVQNAVGIHTYVNNSKDMLENLVNGLGYENMKFDSHNQIVLSEIVKEVHHIKKSDIYWDNEAQKLATYDFLKEVSEEPNQDVRFKRQIDGALKEFNIKDNLKLIKIMNRDVDRFIKVLKSADFEKLTSSDDVDVDLVAKMLDLYASDTAKKNMAKVVEQLPDEFKIDSKSGAIAGAVYAVARAIVSVARYIAFSSDARLVAEIKSAFVEVQEKSKGMADLTVVKGRQVNNEVKSYVGALTEKLAADSQDQGVGK